LGGAATAAETARHAHGRRRPTSGVSAEALATAAKLFRSAGDEQRLRLLELLAEGEWCVTELAQATEANLSTVSQRLSVLRADGLVARRREGKHAWYRLADEHVADLVTNALAHAGENH
jgi:DNA-binding transcriptional ArsR family regulator